MGKEGGDDVTEKTLLEQTKQRFANDERLRGWMNVLAEYIFPDGVLVQLRDKSPDTVALFCADIDE